MSTGYPVARLLFDHLDRVTGIHYVFCAYGSRARLVRGAFNTATGTIDWNAEPELSGSGRMLSGGDCNGWLYACISSDGDPHNEDGGVFWREDGPGPRWHLIHEFPMGADVFPPSYHAATS